jgi:hypothetical protein
VDARRRDRLTAREIILLTTVMLRSGVNDVVSYGDTSETTHPRKRERP